MNRPGQGPVTSLFQVDRTRTLLATRTSRPAPERECKIDQGSWLREFCRSSKCSSGCHCSASQPSQAYSHVRCLGGVAHELQHRRSHLTPSPRNVVAHPQAYRVLHQKPYIPIHFQLVYTTKRDSLYHNIISYTITVRIILSFNLQLTGKSNKGLLLRSARIHLCHPRQGTLIRLQKAHLCPQTS